MNSASKEDLRCGDACRDGTCIVVFMDDVALPGHAAPGDFKWNLRAVGGRTP